MRGWQRRPLDRRLRFVLSPVVLALVATVAAWIPSEAPLVANAVGPTPVARWTFDEGSGASAGDAVGNLDGALSGGATWLTSGAPEGTGAIAFDGIDGLVSVASAPALEPTGGFSVLLWVRSSVTPSNTQPTIAQKGFYGCDTGGSWTISQGSDTAVGSTYLTAFGHDVRSETDYRRPLWDGAWHRLLLVVDDTNDMTETWVDGYKTTLTWPGVDEPEFGATGRLDDALLIGGSGADCPYGASFEGAIDDLRFYDSALTDAEASALMPVHDTSTTATVSQGGYPVTTAYTDLATLFSAVISPPPGEDGTTTWYLSAAGGPETAVATSQIFPGSWGYTSTTMAPGTLAAGSYTVRAAWGGSSNWEPSSSEPVAFTMIRRPVVMELAADPTNDIPGGGSTLQARVRVENPPSTYRISGNIEFYDTTGETETLLGTAPLSYAGGDLRWNVASYGVSGLADGTHTYEARFAGDTMLASASAATSVVIGLQWSAMHLSFSPNPVLTTAEAIASINLMTSRRGSSSAVPLPPPTGTLTLKRVSTGAVIGSVAVSGDGVHTIPLPAYPAGTVGFVAEYSGDANYSAATSNTADLVVQADVVEASGVTVGYTSFYPVTDGYRDTLPIKGVRNEVASVAIRVYNASNKIMKSYSLGLTSGAYSVSWNGRTSSGSLLPAGTYRVVQTLTDTAGVNLVVTRSVSLSWKKIYYYTKTLTKLGSSYSSVGTSGGGKVTKYSDGSIRLYGGSGWAGTGWQFALPSAAAYKSISLGVYGSTGVPLGYLGAQNFTICSYSSTWDIGCFDRWTALRSSTGWASRSVSTSANRHGTAVRLAVSQNGGSSRVYRVRLIVTYGLLK